VDQAIKGATLNKAKLKKIKFHYPPSRNEQIKIAEILATVDQAIEQTEALIAKQQRIKTGLMQDLLTRGIDEHGQLRTEQTHAFKDSPLGRIPAEWEVQTLESVSEFVTSGSRGWAQYYSTEGALFLRIGNLTRKHINMRFDDVIRVSPPASSEGERTAVQKDDLLISITADLGIVAVIPDRFETAYVNQHIALTRLNRSLAHARFIGWFLNGQSGQAQFDKLNESGAKAGLNLPSIKNLQIPVLPLDEQVKIAEVIDAATAKTDEFHARLVKCQSLKRGLMQDLLTGRKRVTDLLEPVAA
jgi:type I restriction enzyme S subunit